MLDSSLSFLKTLYKEYRRMELAIQKLRVILAI